MLSAVLFFCIGFTISLLSVDLLFDTSALPYRRSRERLPPEVLNLIVGYYRYITRNPYPMALILLTGVICVVAEVLEGLEPQWVGYASLLLIAVFLPIAVFKVFPAARRLASGVDTIERQSRMVQRLLLPYHVLAMISVASLGILQLIIIRKS